MGKKAKKSKSNKWESESSEGEFEWVEKEVEQKEEIKQKIGPSMPPSDVNISDIAREQEKAANASNDWLGSGSESDLFSSLGKMFHKSKDKREETRKIANDELVRVQNERELNPYLKSKSNNDTVPSASSSSVTKSFGDGGLTWWTRSLELCKQLANDESRSLESVASERYGSLENLMNKIKAAKEAQLSSRVQETKFFKPGQMESNQRYGSSQYQRDGGSYEKRENWRRKDDQGHQRKSDAHTQSRSQVADKKPSISSRQELIKRSRSRSSSSSESSTGQRETPKQQRPKSPVIRTEIKNDDPMAKYANKDVNELGAAIIKAELCGNDDLACKLKSLLESKKNAKTNQSQAQKQVKPNETSAVIIATKTDRFGNEIPLSKSDLEHDEKVHAKSKHKKARNLYTKEGDRETYFADDNKYSLKDLVEKEKHIGIDDNNLMFSTIGPKLASKLNSDNMDDDILDNCINKQLDGWSKIKVLAEQKSKTEALNNCEFCLENAKKHLILSLGSKSYLSVPETVSLVDGHCLIVPIQHYMSTIMLDEDVWSEMQNFRRALVDMFKSRNMDCIFVEQFANERSFQHMFIECIPISYETAEVAPMYFKKALLEAEKNWAQNKPIVDLRGKGVRKSLPKGLPYFSVDFGLEDGFAHIIEDKEAFPSYFAKEIIGGIMDLDPYLWRKVRKEKFSEHSKKVMEFLKYWKKFDFNKS